MMRFLPMAWIVVVALAGCSDFSQHRFGGVRNLEPVAEAAPKPAPALFIPNPPASAGRPSDKAVQPATFIPDRPELPAHNPLQELHQRASKQIAGMDSYIFRLRRREAVDGKKMPEEIVRIAVRREPFSVHLKWVGAEGKGRETVYVKGKYDDKMQVRLAANDAFPFSPAGIRWSVAIDDERAKARSRYPITNTGLASLIESFGKTIGDEVNVKYLGRVKRPEFETALDGVHQVVPAKRDPLLPRGGQRCWYFDTTNGLPVLVIAQDPDGEVEYYCHDHIQWPVRLDDDDFNPDRLWRK